MKYCISNLAWSYNDEKIILNLIKKKIKFLEYSPTLLIKDLKSKENISKIKKIWNKRNISLYSMQSILYNTSNTYIFGNKYQRQNFYNEVKKKIILAKKLKTKVIVFGSPKNKKTFKKKKIILDKLSLEMFKKISLLSKKNKITFCVEANPEIYGTKYLTHTIDAIKLAKKINNRYFKVNLDLGTIISNNEDLDFLLKNYLKYFGHAQISSPYLTNLLKYKKSIKFFINKLNKYRYKKIISIETLKRKKNNLNYIKNIIKFLSNR